MTASRAGSPSPSRNISRTRAYVPLPAAAGCPIGHREVPWLPGYEGATPVRFGNPAADQFQLDIYGEVLDSLYLCEQAGLDDGAGDVALASAIVAHLEKMCECPDQGIWESRGPPQGFTYSKVMAWVGIDRFLKLAQIREIPSAAGSYRLKRLQAELHAKICRDGFNAARSSFVQSFGSEVLDASLLLLPLVGFLPINDTRITGTIAAIERELVEDGLVRRWSRADGPDEGTFIACTCWLADCLEMQRRTAEARAYFERVLALRNDVGLLSEEWHVRQRRMMGNFPQALSHLALINTALRLCGPVLQRGRE